MNTLVYDHVEFAPEVAICLDRSRISNRFGAYEVDKNHIESVLSGSIDASVGDELIQLGLIFVKKNDKNFVHFSELCYRLVHVINNRSDDLYGNSSIKKIIEGNLTRSQAQLWVTSMFDFTKSAKTHIGSMILNSEKRNESVEIWREFFKEEENHWLIYRKIFKSIGINIDIQYQRPLYPPVSRFVNHLIKASNKSELHYAALLYSIEQGPGCDSLEEDAQFYSLVKHYKFNYSDVQPLFEHTKLNDRIGHSSLWYQILKSHTWYEERVCKEITESVLEHAKLSDTWMDSLFNV